MFRQQSVMNLMHLLEVNAEQALAPPLAEPFQLDAGLQATLIIPAHNEEERLATTLRTYGTAFADRFGDDFELIVVANACSDGTAELARSMQASFTQLRVIEINEVIGKGGAILEGFARARGSRVLFADADGATSAGSLLAMAEALDNHDIVVGSRRLPDSAITTPQPGLRRVCGHLFSGVVRAAFRMPIQDTQCGAKAFRRQILPEMQAGITERQWTFDVNLLLVARDLGLSIHEQPVVWSNQSGSRFRLLPALASIAPSLMRLKLRRRYMPSSLVSKDPARELDQPTLHEESDPDTAIAELRSEIARWERIAKRAEAERMRLESKLSQSLASYEPALIRGKPDESEPHNHRSNLELVSTLTDSEVNLTATFRIVESLAAIEDLVDSLERLPGVEILSQLYRAGSYRIDMRCDAPVEIREWLSNRSEVESLEVDGAAVRLTLVSSGT